MKHTSYITHHCALCIWKCVHKNHFLKCKWEEGNKYAHTLILSCLLSHPPHIRTLFSWLQGIPLYMFIETYTISRKCKQQKCLYSSPVLLKLNEIVELIILATLCLKICSHEICFLNLVSETTYVLCVCVCMCRTKML